MYVELEELSLYQLTFTENGNRLNDKFRLFLNDIYGIKKIIYDTISKNFVIFYEEKIELIEWYILVSIKTVTKTIPKNHIINI